MSFHSAAVSCWSNKHYKQVPVTAHVTFLNRTYRLSDHHGANHYCQISNLKLHIRNRNKKAEIIIISYCLGNIYNTNTSVYLTLNITYEKKNESQMVSSKLIPTSDWLGWAVARWACMSSFNLWNQLIFSLKKECLDGPNDLTKHGVNQVWCSY